MITPDGTTAGQPKTPCPTCGKTTDYSAGESGTCSNSYHLYLKLPTAGQGRQAEVEQYFKIISDESFDLTPFIDFANKLQKLGEKGQVNDIRRELVLFYDNLLKRAELNRAVAELQQIKLKLTVPDFMVIGQATANLRKMYDIQITVIDEHIATLTAERAKLDKP